MIEEKRNTGNGKAGQSSQNQNDWQVLLDKVTKVGLVKNIPFMTYLCLLGIVYITYSQKIISIQRAYNKAEKELTELRWKYMDIKSKLAYEGMETEVLRNGANVGLKPLMLPAYKIENNERKKE